MDSTSWLLIDTETTGFKKPIFAVEIAVQKMRGWKADGPSFRKIINHSCDIPPEASRVNGYTKEILERDGELPDEVYAELLEYGEGLPICAYNLEYDYNRVLMPEWQRLGIDVVSPPGICLLQLAQRLLDPVPAGNCKLQTLRQYYRLPERGAHTALGDVETVVDLIQKTLKPIIVERNLNTWDDIVQYTTEAWYPTRIAFGKHKGRHFQEARKDNNLLGWIKWLTESTNPRTSRMGNWYLDNLETDIPFALLPGSIELSNSTDLVSVSEELKKLIAIARDRLATLEVEYTIENNKVEVIQKTIFTLLKEVYWKRDQINIIIEYRQIFLDKMMYEGEEEAESVWEECKQAERDKKEDYEKLEAEAKEQKVLSEEDQKELKNLWRKLVGMFHPDRFAGDEVMRDTYTKMTTLINRARDQGDIDLLREIALDPETFMIKHGMNALDLTEEKGVANLKLLLESLQMETFNLIEKFDQLKESPEYEIWKLSEINSDIIVSIGDSQKEQIAKEIESLEEKAQQLKDEIDALTES